MKDLFLLNHNITYLNHGSYGACPARVFENYQNWQRKLEADFKINNVDHVKFVNDENCDPSIALRTFFKNRLKSRRH